MAPDLSIILPAYNAERYIEQAISSILNQSFENFELLIANDASTDGTSDVIRQFSDERIRRIDNSTNLGKVRTCNRVMAQTRGEFVTVHDADDWSATTRFEAQLAFLREYPNYVMCGTSFVTVDQSGRHLSVHTQPDDYGSICLEIRERSQFHGPTLVFRKAILEVVGGFYRGIKMGEDIDFSMRVVEKFPATNLAEPLYYYRVSPSSLTKSANHDLQSKLVDRHLIYFFAEERRRSGVDSLQKNDLDEVERQREIAIAEFQSNRARYQDEYLAYLLHYGLSRQALGFVFAEIRRYGLSASLIKQAAYLCKRRLSGAG